MPATGISRRVARALPSTFQPRSLIAALAGAGAIAAIAIPLGTLVPLLGAPILALAIGMAVATLLPESTFARIAARTATATGAGAGVPAGAAARTPTAQLQSGLSFVSRYVLQAAIVTLGATIDLQAVARVGIGSLPVMLGSLTAALAAAAVLGRLLGVPRRLRTLLGVGTGICGASAIAAVSGVTRATERELSYAISTIFVFNLLAVLLFIPLGHAMGMSQHQFGLWDGTAVNDVSSVVAAGFAFGHAAGAYALIVKLTRTTMIIPITLALANMRVHLARRRAAGGGLASGGGAAGAAGAAGDDLSAGPRLAKLVPWFLLFFLLASAADTAGLWGAGTRAGLSTAGLALTTIALAAVGLSSDLREARRTGGRPLALGALIWLTVSVTSLALQHAFGAAG